MISLTINGVTYQYPEPDDENWGTAATGWAEEVTTVLAGVYEPASTPLAASGQFRLPNEGIIAWRDNANSADVKLYVHTDDDLYIQVGANPPINLSTTAAGNVTGPGSATDNAIARYDGVSGQVIQNSVVTVSDTGNVSGVNVLTATQADAADINATASLTVTGTSALYGDTDVGDGTYTGTAPLLTVNANTGDAGIRLQVNNTSTNAWDIYNDNSDSDQLKFDFNGTTYVRTGTTGGLVVQASNASEVAITAYQISTGDAAIKLRVNNTPNNEWTILNDNSDSDKLKLQYAGSTSHNFHTNTADPLEFVAENISTATAPIANGLYPHSMVKAWGRIDGDGTTAPDLDDGFNVSSISASGEECTVTFRTNMANANYSVIVTGHYLSGKATASAYYAAIVSQSTSSFTFRLIGANFAAGPNNVDFLDLEASNSWFANFIVVGRQ